MAHKKRTAISTDKQVASLKPEAKRYAVAVKSCMGLYCRVSPDGTKSFCAVAREPHEKKQIWATIGPADHYTLSEAADAAREAIRRIKAGQAAFPKIEPTEEPDSFAAVFENYFERYVKRQKLRSAGEIDRAFRKYILPVLGARPFEEIRRSDVARLLDTIEDNNGPVMADRCLAYMSKIFNWFASRSDDFSSPIVRGMSRTKPQERARERILNDDEIRVIWKVAEGNGTFGAIIRLALLTGQRRETLTSMRWQDISGNVWTIPDADREKGHGGAMVLTGAALDIIRERPRIGDSPFVFPAARGSGHFSGWSPCKRAFDQKVLVAMRREAIEAGDDPDAVEPLPRWTLHDLRRTARSMMSRAGVQSEHAERLMGHKIKGVESVYDRHSYRDEKAEALAKLAALIGRIVAPPADNVKPLFAEA